MAKFTAQHESTLKGLGCSDAQVAQLKGCPCDPDCCCNALTTAKAQATALGIDWAKFLQLLIPLLLSLFGQPAPLPAPAP